MSSVGGIVTSAIGVVLALILVFLVWRNLKALRRRADEMQLLTASAVGQPLLDSGGVSYAANGSSVSIAPLPAFGDTAQAKIQERLRLVADEKPEEIVGLVNSWLHADGTPSR
jgi:flagellar biosynthesis/type III secretory pathway M-ring protein FliF/YscJ